MTKNKRNGIILTSVIIGSYIILFLLMKIGLINNYNKGIIILSLINITLAVSLNLTMGFLGQLALGHAGFMAIGAYTSAIINIYTEFPPIIGLILGIVAGGTLAAFSGFIIGVPTLRLRGDYLAIVTLAFNEIIRNVLESISITNGSKGLSGIPKYTSFTIAYIIMAICVVSIILLIKSRHGRAIISIREDEIAAEASGINTIYYKLFAFCLSAFFAGIAGALYAHYLTTIKPSDFGYTKSIEIAIMAVLGGLGNITGSIISAFALTALPQFLITLQKYRMLIYSTILILTMVLKYNGVLDKVSNYFKTFFNKKKEGK